MNVRGILPNRLFYEEISRRTELPFLEVCRLSSSIARALFEALHMIGKVEFFRVMWVRGSMSVMGQLSITIGLFQPVT